MNEIKSIVSITTNLRGNYEYYYYDKLIAEAKTLELLNKKASKYFKGQGL